LSKVIDYEYDYFGLWSPGGICRVRIYTQEGQLPFVVLTELEKNRSASVTNMAECIAAEIAERHTFLRVASGSAEPPFLLMVHHPRMPEEVRWGWEPSFCSVTFSSYEPRRTYSYPMANHGKRPPQSLRLGAATFVHLSEAEVHSLLGGRRESAGGRRLPQRRAADTRRQVPAPAPRPGDAQTLLGSRALGRQSGCVRAPGLQGCNDRARLRGIRGIFMSAPQPSLFSDPAHERRQAQKMRGEKTIIKVAYGKTDDAPPTFREREATVYGTVYGLLALMPALLWDGTRSRHRGWNITHVPSGLAIAPSIPEKAEALRVIYLLRDEDWSFRHKAQMPEKLRQKTRRLVEEASTKAAGAGSAILEER